MASEERAQEVKGVSRYLGWQGVRQQEGVEGLSSIQKRGPPLSLTKDVAFYAPRRKHERERIRPRRRKGASGRKV